MLNLLGKKIIPPAKKLPLSLFFLTNIFLITNLLYSYRHEIIGERNNMEDKKK